MTQYNQLGSALPGDETFTNTTGSDIAAGYCVALDATKPGEIKLTTADTDFYGITMETIKNGKSGRVRAMAGGIATAVCSAAITVDGLLMSDSAGKLTPLTGVGAFCAGRAMSSTGATGETVQVKLLIVPNAVKA